MARNEHYRHSRADNYQREYVLTGKGMPRLRDDIVEQARVAKSATQVQDCFGSGAAARNEGGN